MYQIGLRNIQTNQIEVVCLQSIPRIGETVLVQTDESTKNTYRVIDIRHCAAFGDRRAVTAVFVHPWQSKPFSQEPKTPAIPEPSVLVSTPPTEPQQVNAAQAMSDLMSGLTSGDLTVEY